MTKILYVTGTLEVGGAERQLVETAIRLDRTRYQPVVCCLSVSGDLEQQLHEAGIPVHFAGFRGFLRSSGPMFLARLPELLRVVAGFIRLFRRERPDVVHGYLFWAYVLGAYVGRMTRTPVVVSSRRSLSHFKAGKPHYALLERIANRLTDLVVANSEAVREDAIRTEGLDPEKVIVIHNGIDAAAFTPTSPGTLRGQLRIGSACPVVAVVANLIHYKGHRYFLQAWAVVRSALPGAVALLAGDGPMRQEIERQADELGLTDSLRFLGVRNDVPALLAESDLLVHPSLEEGFCNAILEAMAAGRAVVATRVGGNSEAVIDGETGLLCPAADPGALAEAMVALLTDDARRRRMGEAGRRRAESEFGMSRMVRRYEQLYERLVDRR